MRYVILKQLLPSLEGTEGYDESMNFIIKCICIEDDEVFLFNTIEDAQEKILQLENDKRYLGRKLKIKELF
jgi:hypothetical protein